MSKVARELERMKRREFEPFAIVVIYLRLILIVLEIGYLDCFKNAAIDYETGSDFYGSIT